MFRRLSDLFTSKTHTNRRAGVALIIGLTSPVLIGTTGLAVDASFWVAQHTALQSAIDAAAIKAARDLASNPATPPGTLAADALAAANLAAPAQIALNSSQINVMQLTDARQVQVNATIAGDRFFSQMFYPLPINIHATAVAGVSYPTVSTQATCYAVNSFSYLYSTGFGTIDTSHSSGLDPFQCGSPPGAASPYDAYCGGGVLGCSLDLLSAGNFLLPFGVQLGPNGGAGGLNLVLGPVVNTLVAMLGTSGYGGAGAMTTIGPNSPGCSGGACAVAPGVYNGGLTIQAGTTVSFGAGYYLIENGSLIISTQATINTNSAQFYFAGAHPGGLVAQTQVQINTAPLIAGAIVLQSRATFQSNSLIGTQTASPFSAMPYAQQQAETMGLLSAVGLPAQNLGGTNFESVIATCPAATSSCATPTNQQAVFQSTLLPSLGALPSLLAPLGVSLNVVNLLSNEPEISTSEIDSGVTYGNGAATNSYQTYAATSVLTNVVQTVPGVLASLGISDPGHVLSPLIQNVLNAIALNETNNQSATGSYTFPGQTAGAVPSCLNQPVLYTKTIQPGFSTGFTDILNTSGQNGATGTLATADTVTVCGQQDSQISAITSQTPIVSSTAAASSAIFLMQ